MSLALQRVRVKRLSFFSVTIRVGSPSSLRGPADMIEMSSSSGLSWRKSRNVVIDGAVSIWLSRRTRLFKLTKWLVHPPTGKCDNERCVNRGRGFWKGGSGGRWDGTPVSGVSMFMEHSNGAGLFFK